MPVTAIIDVEQACIKASRCHDVVRDTCLEFNVSITDEMLLGIGHKMTQVFTEDSPVSLSVREASMDSSLRYWVSHLRAFKNDRNAEDYRKKCKSYALNIDNVFTSYRNRLSSLQKVIDDQYASALREEGNLPTTNRSRSSKSKT